MEKAAHNSNLPRPSAIPRPPRLAASTVTAKSQSLQLPADYGLAVPTSRFRANQARNQVITSQEDHGLEFGSQELNQEVGNKPSPLQDVDSLSTQQPLPRELSLNPSGGQSDSTDHGRNEEHSGARALEYCEPEAESARKKSSALSRRPRMSLSDRTIETLSQIPPSPSPRRRKSNFFPVKQPASSLSRPVSSLGQARLGSNGF